MSKKNDGQYKDVVPYDKCNKREKKRRDNQKRNTWEIPCYTKIEPDKKKKKDFKKIDENYLISCLNDKSKFLGA